MQTFVTVEIDFDVAGLDCTALDESSACRPTGSLNDTGGMLEEDHLEISNPEFLLISHL